MTREEIGELAVSIACYFVGGGNPGAWNVEHVERELVDLRRDALEDAARAVCWKCKAGELTAPRRATDLFHYDGEPCPAEPIHDLIAALKPKEGA